MVKEKNAPLILASLSSILSFVCLMIALQLPSSTPNNVLGTTTSNLVPCSVINSWQKQYCSNVSPTGVPTKPPTTPIPTAYCKAGINSSTYGPTCLKDNIARGFNTLSFVCHGGFSSTVGDKSLVNCYFLSDLIAMANKICLSNSPCTPTPTAYCKAGISSSTYGGACTTSSMAKGYIKLGYICYGGYQGTVGGDTPTCYTPDELMATAKQICLSHSPCTPTPSPTGKPTVTPTQKPPLPLTSTPTMKPTAIPSRYPTVTPTAVPTPATPHIDRAYPEMGIVNNIICFYGTNFVGNISYPITQGPKIEFFDQSELLLSETLGSVNQHGKWEDKQVCTTINNPAFSGKGISVIITNYSQKKSNGFYYYFK